MIAKKMLLEAVTVAVNYGDFLEEIIPHNLPQIDHWTVVTTPADSYVQKLCAKYGIRCLKTECFFRDVDPPRLNKSRGINFGLAHLSQRGWVLHLDADIVLPGQFRKMIENADLDTAAIYGMDRVNCPSVAEWDAYLGTMHSRPQYEWSCFVNPPRNWPIGTRLTHGDYGGYMPIGYFQLWNPRGSSVNRYPILLEGDMEHTDVLFSMQWDRPRRHLLPEGYAIHLQSSGGRSMNWRGRKTPQYRQRPSSYMA